MGPPQDHQEQSFRRHIGDLVIVGADPGFLGVVAMAEKFAESDYPVLIQGETGTGKEIMARAIHYLSQRRSGPFEVYSCGTTPPDLVENELFGHAPEAYTNASGTQEGIIDKADGGTLFLDEIHNLPTDCQSKLLRVLDTGEYRPLGGAALRKANVRIVCACNRDLRAEVAATRFQKDLFYRIAWMELVLPPLRDRPCDIMALASHFLREMSENARCRCAAFSPCAERALLNHEWQGNVRELQSRVARAVTLVRSCEVTAGDLGFSIGSRAQPRPSLTETLKEKLRAVESEYIKQVLELSGGDIQAAARMAGRELSSFYRLVRKHRINLKQYREASPV
jgi:two-component system, NtrC family, response regulator GlrR